MMYYDQVLEAAAAIRKVLPVPAKIGIILGTGLGSLGDQIELTRTLDYRDIPHFPLSTVESPLRHIRHCRRPTRARP